MVCSCTSPVFTHYQHALGENNIKLAVVEESDPLEFLEKNDIALLRTASENLITTIKNRGCKTTAEEYYLYSLVNDKFLTTETLRAMNIPVPRTYSLATVQEGKTYFVKPRRGSDSFGISADCICHSVDEVEIQVARFGVAEIEDYIKGNEYTMSCAIIDGKVISAAVRVKTDERCGIQTQEIKNGAKKWVYEVSKEKAKQMHEICEFVVKQLHIKHHVRIDFREDEHGRMFPIDVNLLPGLGPIGFWALCWASSKGLSYKKAMELLINTAT